MKAAVNIWIVDDDPAVRFVFGRALSDAGYRVVECSNGREALKQLESEAPALVILDVDMPQMNGWKTLEELRRRGIVQPVLMLTSENAVPSRVRGLEMGADDYIGKPCEPTELLARVKALLRRPAPRPSARSVRLRIGDVIVDLDSKTATKGRMPLRLTRTDYALLTLLHENLGKPVTHARILDAVWGGRAGNAHALETHLWRLRRKLGDTGDAARLISNVPGIGYMMTARPA